MGRAPLLLLLSVGLTATVSGTSSPEFDMAFSRFLSDHGYTGGAVTALKDGRLVLAKGYGVTRKGSEVKAWSRVPVTRLSHSLTSVAVMTLVQRGLVSLDDRVFGRQGILHMFHPIHPARADPRLYDVTVGHLLRHSAGWDSSQGPLYDPVLNDVYRSRGHPEVPSIVQAMDVASPVDGFSLIRYVISQPLHFTPGSRVSVSNVGYVVLGRVVEETSKVMYEDYVKKHVLVPCGMWRTRLWLPANTQTASIGSTELQPVITTSQDTQRDGDTQRDVSTQRDVNTEHDVNKPHDVNTHRDADTFRENTKQRDGSSQHVGSWSEEDGGEEDVPLVELLDSLGMDSALGWSSTAMDMVRFTRCVFDGDTVLDDGSLDTLLQPPDTQLDRHHDSWVSAGFTTNARGEVWQDADPNGDDVILYHDQLAGRGEGGEGPDTWAVLLHGSHLHHLRHKMRDLIERLTSATRHNGTRHVLVSDLTDVTEKDDVLVKFRVDEHHLDAYVSAVKREGYDVTWVFPYSHPHHTSFLLVSRHPHTRQPYYDFRLEHGLSEKQLLSRKLGMERRGYNLTFLQSYRSESHHHPHSFLAIFRPHAYPALTQLKYGTGHLPQPYDRLVQMYREKSFHPLVQSVLPDETGEEERLSFVFMHSMRSTPLDFTHHYRLNATELDSAILSNAARGRTLSFLDAYTLQREPRFAAIFSNATRPRWTWEGGLDESRAAAIIASHVSRGLWPALAVAYTDHDQRHKLSVFFKRDQDTQRSLPRVHTADPLP